MTIRERRTSCTIGSMVFNDGESLGIFPDFGCPLPHNSDRTDDSGKMTHIGSVANKGPHSTYRVAAA